MLPPAKQPNRARRSAGTVAGPPDSDGCRVLIGGAPDKRAEAAKPFPKGGIAAAASDARRGRVLTPAAGRPNNRPLPRAQAGRGASGGAVTGRRRG
ncbi:hypothetical protein GCM10009834_36120 [Streptomonospora arabica]